MKVAGASRCVVWANVVRPPYRGVSYRGYNRVLADYPDWFAKDGVHVSVAGYRARAKAVARAASRCP